MVHAVKDPTSIKTEDLVLVSYQPSEMKKMGGSDSRLVEFTITTDRLDRDQDTIAVDGWDFKDYQKNPVVLWCHDHYSMPIARSLSLTLGGNSIKSICEFAPKELAGGFGYMVYRMYAEGFMNAVSVGMQPMEWSVASDRKYGLNYLKQSLLEYSCVPVPANADALAVARSKGIDMSPMRDWASRMLDERTGMSDDARRQMEVLRSVSSPSGRALILEIGDMKMAGTAAEKEAPTPAPTSAVKQVTRWDCGEKGHAHESEQEAKSCNDFDVAVTNAVKSLQELLTLKKAGKTIKTEAGALLRSVVDEIVPPVAAAAGDPAKKEDEGEQPATDPANGDEEKGFNLGALTEEDLAKAINAGVEAEFNKATGRVQ